MTGSKLKQELFVAAQASAWFLVVALVLAGIGGTVYKVISPGGWITQAFGRSLSAGVASVGSLLLVFALAWFSRGWSSPRHRSRMSDLVVYGFAIAGLLYLLQLLQEGRF